MIRLMQATALGAAMLAGGPAAASTTGGMLTARHAQGFVLGAGGTTITPVRDFGRPMLGAPVTLMSGGMAATLDAITYRPNTGGYFGYQDATDTVFSIDTLTGELTPVAMGMGTNPTGQPIGTSTAALGFDFNNQIDAARIVSVNDENLVFFPPGSSGPDGVVRPGGIVRPTDLFYVDGDPNEGADPAIFANAYTNAVPQPVDVTVQYVLDAELDVLATLGNNLGTLETLGQIFVDGSATALDFSDVGGLDILSTAIGQNLAIALLNVDGMSTLYSFMLPEPMMMGPVTATRLGTIGEGYSSLAVAPAPIPLPAAGVLLVGALGGLVALKRRRKPAA